MESACPGGIANKCAAVRAIPHAMPFAFAMQAKFVTRIAAAVWRVAFMATLLRLCMKWPAICHAFYEFGTLDAD